jgi:hypothetical protein
MDCCVLSAEEVGRLIHYGLWPNHADHYHLKFADAMQKVSEEELNIVTVNGRNYCTPSILYSLKSIPSGPNRIRVIQRTKRAPLKKIYPVR